MSRKPVGVCTKQVRWINEAAKKIIDEDDWVDNLYNQVFRKLLIFMAGDQRTITLTTCFIWMAPNLE